MGRGDRSTVSLSYNETVDLSPRPILSLFCTSYNLAMHQNMHHNEA